MSVYERQVIAERNERRESRLADLEVSVSVVDLSGKVRNRAAVRTPASGFVEDRAPLLQGLEPGAYLLMAQATARGQTLDAGNIFLVGRTTLNLNWAMNDLILVVPLARRRPGSVRVPSLMHPCSERAWVLPGQVPGDPCDLHCRAA